MNQRCFEMIGLVLNTLGSLILLIPIINIYHHVGENYIVKMDSKGKFFQKKHLNDRMYGLAGFILLLMGFIFQIIGLLI